MRNNDDAIGLLVGSWLAFAVLLVVSMLLGGCSLIPSESASRLKQQQRESIAGRTTTDVVSHSKAELPVVDLETKDGTKIRIQHGESRLDASTGASEEAATSESLFDTTSKSVPFFVKIIGAAIGVGLLALVIFWVIRKVKQGAAGAAAATAFHAADQSMSSMINGLRRQAIAETDPEKTVVLSAQIADLEKSRGRLAGEQNKPSPKGT